MFTVTRQEERTGEVEEMKFLNSERHSGSQGFSTVPDSGNQSKINQNGMKLNNIKMPRVFIEDNIQKRVSRQTSGVSTY